jgi:excisionase family DNA binding protein
MISDQDRRVFTIAEFARIYGLSRGTVYKLASTGELRISKILGKTVIRAADAEAWEKNLRRIGEVV